MDKQLQMVFQNLGGEREGILGSDGTIGCYLHNQTVKIGSLSDACILYLKSKLTLTTGENRESTNTVPTGASGLLFISART